VVLAGETDTEVPVTVPTPWSIDTEVAPLTVHDSTELCPPGIDGGLATNDWIVGPALLPTVTARVAVMLPDAFVAVSV
jgi:hypothetical protein